MCWDNPMLLMLEFCFLISPCLDVCMFFLCCCTPLFLPTRCPSLLALRSRTTSECHQAKKAQGLRAWVINTAFCDCARGASSAQPQKKPCCLVCLQLLLYEYHWGKQFSCSTSPYVHFLLLEHPHTLLFLEVSSHHGDSTPNHGGWSLLVAVSLTCCISASLQLQIQCHTIIHISFMPQYCRSIKVFRTLTLLVSKDGLLVKPACWQVHTLISASGAMRSVVN